MGFGETLVSVFGVMFVFGAPVVLIRTILAHKQKMREIEVRGLHGSDSSLRAEIEAMRHEMRSLRDTTTHMTSVSTPPCKTWRRRSRF